MLCKICNEPGCYHMVEELIQHQEDLNFEFMEILDEMFKSKVNNKKKSKIKEKVLELIYSTTQELRTRPTLL